MSSTSNTQCIAAVPVWLLDKYYKFNTDGNDAFFKDNLQQLLVRLMDLYPAILSPAFGWKWFSLEIDYHIHEFLVRKGYTPAGGPWASPPGGRMRFGRVKGITPSLAIREKEEKRPSGFLDIDNVKKTKKTTLAFDKKDVEKKE